MFYRQAYAAEMHINAATKQIAIVPCKENTKHSVPFSKDESKQTYAVVLKVPAMLTAVRKLADVDENSGAISFKGTLYPNEKVIIFNIAEGKPAKKRNRKKKEAAEAVSEGKAGEASKGEKDGE